MIYDKIMKGFSSDHPYLDVELAFLEIVVTLLVAKSLPFNYINWVPASGHSLFFDYARFAPQDHRRRSE